LGLGGGVLARRSDASGVDGGLGSGSKKSFVEKLIMVSDEFDVMLSSGYEPAQLSSGANAR
jgi:hypothetical protein